MPDDPRKMRPTGFERLPVPSMEHASVDMLVDEMKAAGITKGVLHGRHTGNARYGDVSLSLIHICSHMPVQVVSWNAQRAMARARMSGRSFLRSKTGTMMTSSGPRSGYRL